MNHLPHEQGSSLLDEDNQTVPKNPANKRKFYQQPVSSPKHFSIQVDLNLLLKIAGAIGIIVTLMVIYLVIQLQSNPLLLLSNTQSQPLITEDQNLAKQQETQFGIEFKQKPIPSSPSQRPPELNPHLAGPNPWLESVTNYAVRDKYFLKVEVEKMIEISDPQLFFGKDYKKNLHGITQQQLQLGLNMLYITHNVNLKGQIQVQMAPYDWDKQTKAKRIKQLLTAQQKLYQQKYDFKSYLSSQLPFCIVSPSYNNVNSKLYLRYLDSIFMQQYDNFHIVYIDDVSPDRTGEYVKQYVKEKGFPEDKIQVIINEHNLYALENIYNAVHYHCSAGDIVMLVDGDDALVGRHVFGVFNAVYQRTESALIYSSYLHVIYNEKALVGASSQPIPMNLIKRHGAVRNEHTFFTSHLLTFYVDLFRKINKSDLTYDNGTFFKYAYDAAMCTPMLQMISDRVFYLPELTYEYRYDTGQNDPGSGQTEVTAIVWGKKVYDRLEQLPFVDDRENYLKTAPKYSLKP